jgi:hypothetical protein
VNEAPERRLLDKRRQQTGWICGLVSAIGAGQVVARTVKGIEHGGVEVLASARR